MALIECHECHKGISTEAKACPHCGARTKPPKQPMSNTFKVLLVILGIGILGAVMTAPSSNNSPATGTDANRESKPTLPKMVSGCKVAWEMASKKKMHDPDSLDWDSQSAELGIFQKKTPVVMVPYRAKNGFGGLTLHQAICEIKTDTGEIVRVIQ